MDEESIREVAEVSKLPRPWKDCMCNEVAGDNEMCKVHPIKY